MREYGQIQCSFWSDPDIQGVSDDAKLIALYILSGPHSNGLGCYRIPDGYIQADTGMTSETVSKGFKELFSIGFCLRCETTKFVLIPKFLKWNTVANKNVAAAREKEFKAVPEKFMYYSELCNKILEYGNHLSNGFETVLKGYAKQDPTRPDQDPDQTKDQTGETMPSKLDASRDILEFLNQSTGKSFQPVDANLNLIKARLKEGHDQGTIMAVISSKCEEWPHGHKMHQYLRPATLFNATKFNNYVGELGIETPEQKRNRELEEWAAGGDALEGEVMQ